MVAPPGDGPFESTHLPRQGVVRLLRAVGRRALAGLHGSRPPSCPFVERMEMEFVFPAYTGLAPRTDRARRRHRGAARHDGPPARALDDADRRPGASCATRSEHVPLTVNADGTLAGSFEVKADGLYRIDLASAGRHARHGVAAVHHRRADRRGARRSRSRSPAATCARRASTRSSSRRGAADDFGVRQLDLVYAVNGGPERQARLIGPGAGAARRGVGRPHVLPRGAGPAAGRRRVVLRARDRQRRR